jgi:hypothetical protein
MAVQQSASVDALAALVNKDRLALFDLVCPVSKIVSFFSVLHHVWGNEVDFAVFLLGDFVQVSKMEMYLTTTDHIVRSRGSFISLLCCGHLPHYIYHAFLRNNQTMQVKVRTFFLSSV